MSFLLGRGVSWAIFGVRPAPRGPARLGGARAPLVDARGLNGDLASKNGTFVDGRPLSPQERAILVAGSTVSVGPPDGAPSELVLVDASPPVASATHVATGIVRRAQAGVLLLPDEEQPRASVLEDGGGTFRFETAEETSRVSEGDVVTVEGERWKLDLPATSATLDALSAARTIGAVALRFGVSANEENVEVSVVLRGGDAPSSRSCQYLLLTLARARLSDTTAPTAERGWVDRDALCRMLKMDEYRLNTDVCRARKQFAALGIHGAGDIVQRRVGTGRLRLGVERVSVQRL